MWHTSKPRRQLVCRNNSGKIPLKQLCQGNCKKLKQEQRLTQTLGESHQSQRTPPPPVTLPETKRSPEWEGGLKQKAVTFSHPDESIFQSSEFQFPPDSVQRAPSVHEKSQYWRKLIFDSFSPRIVTTLPICELWLLLLPVECSSRSSKHH